MDAKPTPDTLLHVADDHPCCAPTLRAAATEWTALEARVAEAEKALIGHRKDLHGYSRRPCPTCRASAKALGIEKLVPDSCAYYDEDVAALRSADPTKAESKDAGEGGVTK
jgi:hypothetical protein